MKERNINPPYIKSPSTHIFFYHVVSLTDLIRLCLQIIDIKNLMLKEDMIMCQLRQSSTLDERIDVEKHISEMTNMFNALRFWVIV
jgi:hypothetical protein